MSCASSSHESQQPVYEINPVVVNGETINEATIAAEVQHHPSDDFDEALEKATNALVIQLVLRQQAQAKGLLSEGGDEEKAIAKLLDAEASSPTATDEECRRYFDANRAQFTSSPLVEVSHILLAVAPDDVPGRIETKEHAQAIAKQLAANPDKMASLAKQYSACPSKETQGSLGQISKGQTVSEFEKPLFNLEEGVAINPLETRYGFHVVNIHHKIPGQLLEYPMVKERILQYLNERTQRKAISQYISVLLAQADISGYTPKIDGSPLMQ